jgi:hypothetical protein
MDTSQLLSGNSGDVWYNGNLLSTVSAIKATVKGDYLTTNFIGTRRTFNIYSSWSGSGTLTMDKIDSTILSDVAAAYQSGIMPDIKIITSLTNAAGQTEKVSISGVQFDQFDIVNIESKKLIEDSLSFTFDDYQILDTIS